MGTGQPHTQATQEIGDGAGRTRPGVKRRRLLLNLAAATAAGGVASIVQGKRASAAAGTMMYGASQDAGGAATSLDSSNTLWTFRGENSFGGAGILGVTGGGTGVYGNATTGTGVHAESDSGTALVVKGPSTFDGAVAVDGTVSATAFSGGGAGLAGLNAANLETGTVPDARLGANIARTDGNATFAGKVTAASFAGNGSAITALDARNIAAGIVSRKRLPGLLAYRSAQIAKFRGRVQAKGFSGVGGSAPAFSTAGTVTIKPGKDQVHVVAPGLRNGASVLANIQSNPGADVYVKWIFRGVGSFDVFLTGPVAAPTSLSYLVFKKG